MGFDDAKFLKTVVRQKSGTAEEQARAKRLAGRYVPEMDLGSAASSALWLKENERYLFASDEGDYRWYLDPLAKERGMAQRDLRGPLRADLERTQ